MSLTISLFDNVGIAFSVTHHLHACGISVFGALLSQVTISDPAPPEIIVPSEETPNPNQPLGELKVTLKVISSIPAVKPEISAFHLPSGEANNLPPLLGGAGATLAGHLADVAEPVTAKGGSVTIGYVGVAAPSTLNTAFEMTLVVETSPTTCIFDNAWPPFAIDLSGAPFIGCQKKE